MKKWKIQMAQTIRLMKVFSTIYNCIRNMVTGTLCAEKNCS